MLESRKSSRVTEILCCAAVAFVIESKQSELLPNCGAIWTARFAAQAEMQVQSPTTKSGRFGVPALALAGQPGRLFVAWRNIPNGPPAKAGTPNRERSDFWGVFNALRGLVRRGCEARSH